MLEQKQKEKGRILPHWGNLKQIQFLLWVYVLCCRGTYLDWSSLPQVCLTRTTCRLKCESSGTFPGASIQKVWGGAQESVFFFFSNKLAQVIFIIREAWKESRLGDPLRSSEISQREDKGPLSGEEALDPLAGNMPVCLWGESSPASIFLYRQRCDIICRQHLCPGSVLEFFRSTGQLTA